MTHLIYTVGYNAGWAPEALLREARYLNARVLDIRMNPTSTKVQWRKAELCSLLGGAYQHLPELGNVNYATGGPIQLARPALVVERIQGWLREGPVILMCACPNWQTCHRSEAASYLSGVLGAQVVHLDPPAPQGRPGTIKALTLTQPYASLVALLLKGIETRSWSTSYRGPLAIHAAKGLGPVGGQRGLTALCQTEPFRDALLYANIIGTGQLPLGAIVATCTLVDCRPIAHTTIEYGAHTESGDLIWPISDQERAFGDYTPGRFAWLLSNVKPLPAPVPAKGALGLWDLDRSLLPAGWEV